MSRNYIIRSLLFVVFLIGTTEIVAQPPSVVVDLSLLTGIELTPDNVHNYRIINNYSELKDVTVSGTIRYRNSGLRASFEYTTKLYPGMNRFSSDVILNPHWRFSDNALKELFFEYGKLPQGTYEYCVSVALTKLHTENDINDPVYDCVYQTVNDIFLINLVAPEDEAELYERYPMLSWVVNYPFAHALTYRIRVAALKEGQNKESAVMRNNPVFQEKNLLPTNIIYPATAKSLELFQPYVWTVDAYYKGLLLGGAETWQFTIIEDSLLDPKYRHQSYYDFDGHIGETSLNAYGELKLKYKVDKLRDTLYIDIVNAKGKEILLPENKLGLVNGDNMIRIDLFNDVRLKHNQKYTLNATVNGKKYIIPFTYINPLFND